jgi:hypothetical protein
VSAKKQPQGGIIPPHIITVKGKLVNANVSAKHIDELQLYAETEKYDLESECQSRYGYGPGWLTLTQLGEMFRVIAQRRAGIINGTPKHYHRCGNCGASQMHFDRHCEGKHGAGDLVEECRSCDEGLYLSHRRPGL